MLAGGITTGRSKQPQAFRMQESALNVGPRSYDLEPVWAIAALALAELWCDFNRPAGSAAGHLLALSFVAQPKGGRDGAHSVDLASYLPRHSGAKICTRVRC